MPATLTRIGSPPKKPAQPLSVSVTSIVVRRTERPDSSARKKDMTCTSQEATCVMHCTGPCPAPSGVSGRAPQPCFDEAGQMVQSLTYQTAIVLSRARRLYDKRSRVHMRGTDRHDAALRRHEALAFVQGDRR